MPLGARKRTRSGGGGASQRTIHDLSVDLTSIDSSLLPAVGDAIDLAASLVLDDAQAHTPVDTGFMRSRWRKDKKAELKYSVNNDTWYLPVVNTTSHAGFADRIAERAPIHIKEAFSRLEFEKPGVTSKTAKLALSGEEIRGLIDIQRPLRQQFVAGRR